jgi:AcrR family transcriptional regulator
VFAQRLGGFTRPASLRIIVQEVKATLGQVLVLDAAPSIVRARAFTTQERVRRLKDAGLPVSAIAEAAGVERKTVYSWLDGIEAQGPRGLRVAALHEALVGEAAVQDLREVYRFWTTPIAGGVTLKGLLAAPELDVDTIKQALAVLAPKAALAAERRRRIAVSDGANGFLESGLEIMSPD